MPKSRLQYLKQSLLWLVGYARQGRLVTLIIAATALVVLFLAMQVAGSMNALRSAPQDNVQWSLAQLDVELLAVEIAAHQATHDQPPNIVELRQRFDVFYSRVKTIDAMALFRDRGTSDLTTNTIDSLIAKLDQLVPLVDAPAAELITHLNEITTKLEELRPIARQVTLRGVRLYAAKSDSSRSDLATLLWKTAIFNSLLVLALGATMLFLLRQINISKRRADALQISSDRNASTLVTSQDAIIIINMEGRIVEFNDAATSIFGYSRLAALGAKFDELIIPQRYRERLAHFKQTSDGKLVGAGRFELSALKSDGKEIPVEFSLGITTSPEGQLVIAFIRDISKRIEQESELRTAHDEALEASRAKSQFLAVMSHEMRTPLNGVMAVLDLLDSSKLNAKQKKYVTTATTSAEILKQHVDDVLDLTRIQAGKFELFPRVFDMVELLEEIQSLNVAVAAQRNNRITLDFEMPQPYFVADRKRLHQVLTNLVSNATKFTENGRISISAKFIDVKADLVTIEFRVKDSGVGIAKDEQDRIFEDFVTLDSSYQRSAAGAGLGLPICRSIVEAMGGQIGVESKFGEGSTFWFQLPLKAAFPKTETLLGQKPLETKSRAQRRLKVLVVEDNETNRFVAGEMLDAAGCDVEMAIDGAAGVKIAEAQCFDLILMDLSMPKMNGWDAARRIRATPTSKSRNSPIYALTAHALPEEQEALIKAGMKGCVLKPLRSKDLRALLETVADNLKHRTKHQDHITASNIVDWQVIDEMRELFGEDKFHERLAAFTKELKSILKIIAVKSQDPQEVAKAAHKLAGSAAVFGATQLHATLANMEGAAKRNAQSDVAKLINATKSAAKNFEEALSGK